MAKTSSKIAILVYLALMLSLLLIFSVAEGQLFTNFPSAKAAPSAPTCETVHGVLTGDTCFDVARQFQLTEKQFFGINPNINCNKIFLGQWVCVNGTPNGTR